jgi:uncharacterized repeat protein (TIGR03843 family)
VTAELLARGELRPVARLPESSNMALVCEVDDAEGTHRCVYKPVSGERPLWDFPGTTLAAREVLTAQVAETLGWDLVPTTVWRTAGPLGSGMCQEWVTDVGPRWVALVSPDELPDGWLVVGVGRGPRGERVMLAHADHPALRRLALLDVLVNNADRKGGHLLRRPDGRLAAIDHGVTFHADRKLRTVLWGWVGEPIDPGDLATLDAARDRCARLLDADPLASWITDAERAAFAARIDEVLRSRTFPGPGAEWPALPWPPL